MRDSLSGSVRRRADVASAPRTPAARPPSRLPFGLAGGVLLPALALGAFLLLAPAIGPRDAGRAFAEDEPSETGSINVLAPVGIEDFLRAIAQETNKPILWDPGNRQITTQKIQGALKLTGPKEQLFDMARALLTFYELIMIPVGPPQFQALLVTDTKQATGTLRLKPEFVEITDENVAMYERLDGQFITTTIRVENIRDLKDARNAVQRIVTAGNVGNVTEVPQARSFVVTDFAPNVAAIYRLIKAMDVKPQSSTLTSKYFQLAHATAQELEPILVDLFTGRDRLSAGAPAQPVMRQPGAQTSGDIEQDPEPRIISDPRTNQVIVWATLADIEEIEKVIRNLDVPTRIYDDRVRVIRLKNLEALETAEVLTSLIEAASVFGTESGTTSTRMNERGGRVAQGGSGGSSDPREESKPAVVADEKSNSLIIAGTDRQFDELRRVIDALDVQKDQVLIEAALIELTLDDSYRLSVELGAADANGLVNDAVSGFGFSNYGQTVFADKDGDTFFTDRIPPFVDSDQVLAPRGLVGGIFAFGQVPLIFNVLNSITRSRILQLPSILTADNEEAVIQVQDEQAFSESNASQGAVSGGLGGFETAGTTLRISPHIADATYLLLNINLEVSAFVGEPRTLPSGDQIPADRIRRSLTTVVTVPDRHTVVLGGLMGRTQRSSDDKIPYVSEIPVLGDLFKSTNRTDRETSLFLFVTPTIMHGGQQAFDILDIESCRRKQKADELIGYTEIYNARFVGCDQQDSATGEYTGGVYDGRRPGCLPGQGSAGRSTRIVVPPADGFPPVSAPDAVPGPGELPAPIIGSGSASDRMDSIGMLEATRFHAVSAERLDAERNARRAALRSRGGAAPRAASARGSAQPATIARSGYRPGTLQTGPNHRPSAEQAPSGWSMSRSSGSASEGLLQGSRGYWKATGTCGPNGCGPCANGQCAVPPPSR